MGKLSQHGVTHAARLSALTILPMNHAGSSPRSGTSSPTSAPKPPVPPNMPNHQEYSPDASQATNSPVLTNIPMIPSGARAPTNIRMQQRPPSASSTVSPRMIILPPGMSPHVLNAQPHRAMNQNGGPAFQLPGKNGAASTKLSTTTNSPLTSHENASPLSVNTPASQTSLPGTKNLNQESFRPIFGQASPTSMKKSSKKRKSKPLSPSSSSSPSDDNSSTSSDTDSDRRKKDNDSSEKISRRQLAQYNVSREEFDIAQALINMSNSTPGFAVQIKPSRRLNTTSSPVIPDILCSTPYKYLLEVIFPPTYFPTYDTEKFDIYLTSHATGHRYQRGMRAELQKSSLKRGNVKHVYMIQFQITSFKNKGLKFSFHVGNFYRSTPFKLVARKQKLQNEFWDKHLVPVDRKRSKVTTQSNPKLEDMFSFEDDPDKACAAQLVSLLHKSEKSKKRKRPNGGTSPRTGKATEKANGQLTPVPARPAKKRRKVDESSSSVSSGGGNSTPRGPPQGVSPLPKPMNGYSIITPIPRNQLGTLNFPNLPSHQSNGTKHPLPGRPVIYMRSSPHNPKPNSPAGGTMPQHPPRMPSHMMPQQPRSGPGSAPTLSRMMPSKQEPTLFGRRLQQVAPPPVNTSRLKPPQRPSPLSAPTPPQALLRNAGRSDHGGAPTPILSSASATLNLPPRLPMPTPTPPLQSSSSNNDSATTPHSSNQRQQA
uniref:Uncharacterized protein n=1 Tax=Percolomonas cosmopolitus TaxID=63605 RepID=A0A7S1KPG9_9EUKA|mmetsp:Transcript_3360/g.12767  ORF Transcript_3360/g.12767 Transcript_3360/m.12767 type:complete len:710 (+) Transcript_3360:614-2743(+)|eukprot:CAMPEP_0117451358 /NCGR_PEP_ID=MMETSP0759-20121206/8964_1 /TAXON_ID=63605 /ORGANISM="Percolomonas cosmopolitus, Strain WS" /LENGTH=709 /DNA_ID=CAMNT_0005243951 /DNA_START=608 /DNA_END=2737 /DNA_ORIENTATION=-